MVGPGRRRPVTRRRAAIEELIGVVGFFAICAGAVALLMWALQALLGDPS